MAKTHTLRGQKAGGKILTFRPGFEAKLASAHPYAASLTIESLITDIKRLGVSASLDLDQSSRLMAAGVGRTVDSSAEQYQAWRWLAQGVLSTVVDPERALKVLDFAAHRLLPAPKP